MKMNRWLAIGAYFVAALFLFCAPAAAKEKNRVITPGDFFPDFSFPMTLSKGEVEYLGLPTKFLGLMKGESFSLKDVKADVILVEYMNKYCFSCQLQAPVLNQVFEAVANDPQMKGKVKFLAIAAGNNQTEVDSFRAEKKVPFPIVADPKFLAYEAVGDPGATPFTLLVRKTDSGLVVTRARVGLKRDPEFFLKELNETLRADWNAILSQPKDTSLEKTKARKLQLRYSEEELLKKAQQSMRSPKWKVVGTAKIRLADGEDIYVGEVQNGNQKSYVFARLASRAATCDLCHASHFFFTFDERGTIINFFPLQLTKVDNVPWDSKEVEKMRQRLVGRSILQPMDFDAQVDSISTATMTAALVVDSINKAKALYEGLKAKGYIK